MGHPVHAMYNNYVAYPSQVTIYQIQSSLFTPLSQIREHLQLGRKYRTESNMSQDFQIVSNSTVMIRDYFKFNTSRQ